MPRARRKRLKRIRASISEHKRAILGVILLMMVVSASSMLATQYLMFYLNALGFERIAFASLFLIALLLFAIELRHDFENAAKGVRSSVGRIRGLRNRKSRRRRRK